MLDILARVIPIIGFGLLARLACWMFESECSERDERKAQALKTKTKGVK